MFDNSLYVRDIRMELIVILSKTNIFKRVNGRNVGNQANYYILTQVNCSGSP